MAPLFSKTHDYSRILLSNYFLSQFMYTNQKKNLLNNQCTTYLTLKRKKNRVFSNVATALSILALLFGFMPYYYHSLSTTVDKYSCTWKGKKLFYNLDLLFFLLLPKLKKSKELVKLKSSTNNIEIYFFNLLNMYLLKTLDNDTNLITNITVVNQLTNDVTTTRKLKFFQKALSV